MDAHGQQRRTQGDKHRVRAHALYNALDDGTEGPRVGQYPEKQDGEQEHHPCRRHGADTVSAGDHPAQALDVGPEIHLAGGVLRVGHQKATGYKPCHQGD